MVDETLWHVHARKRGRPRRFPTPEDLWKACEGYFRWVADNPLHEERVFHFQGEITRVAVSKMRAMTITGLCLHLGITHQMWSEHRQRDGYTAITDAVDGIIRQQKFEGAAADLFNANIIARDLGLMEKAEISARHDVIGQVQVYLPSRESDGEDD